jgi:hypothetical protein
MTAQWTHGGTCWRTSWPALFLDVDGTLVPIAETPDAVEVNERMLATLFALDRALHVAGPGLTMAGILAKTFARQTNDRQAGREVRMG